jgi:hypothetical protein
MKLFCLCYGNVLLTLTSESHTGILLICSLVTVIDWVGMVNLPVGIGQSHGIPLSSISLSHLLNITPRSNSQKLSYVLMNKRKESERESDGIS